MGAPSRMEWPDHNRMGRGRERVVSGVEAEASAGGVPHAGWPPPS